MKGLRVIVLGYIIRGPLGGMVWSNLQYLRGLADLGHDVYFLEDSDDYPSCYDPEKDTTGTDPSYGLIFAKHVLGTIGFGERWAYYDALTSRWFGPCADRINSVLATADLLLNLAGVNPLRPWLQGVPHRAFVDEDPAFTQIRNLTDPAKRALVLQHNSFFSFAENIGKDLCSIPDDGIHWRITRQPVVLHALRPTPPVSGKFTTVMIWDSYPALNYRGRRFGMKSDSFDSYIDLPEKVGHVFELAVGGPSAPRSLLAEKGWEVIDPRIPTKDPWTYMEYIRRSRAEFSVAKHGYVVSRSGWFSERSAAYLALGRPTVLQDTGFSEWLDAEGGVLPFSNQEEAVAAIREVNERYEDHCTLARAVAEEYFDASKILPSLINRAMNPVLPCTDRDAERS